MDTYEKKYKEAQKWIESIYPNLSHEQQMEAEAFFPELCESEDEKIRRSLIHLVHLYGGEFGMIDTNTTVEKAITWLEKQGEEKVQAKSLWHEYNHPIDKDRLFLLISKNKRASIMLWNGETLKSVTFGGGGGIILEGDKFAYIDELQEIQNPAEWSEEDEIWIDRACMLLDELNHLPTLAKIPSNINDIISHLKSLKDKYTWKPSEEQMGALWDKISNDNLPNSEKEISQQVALTELYEQLKKLKGE